tara:strand:+ start:10707 stop:11150 length:444 start_codon:yes stop_codon:yes gene_type:complete
MSHPADDDNRLIGYPGHGVGLRNVGSYQVSGEPWLTSSAIAADGETAVSFPYVTQAFTVQVTGSQAVSVGFDTFDNDSTDNHRFDVYPMSSSAFGVREMSQRFEVKCKTVYIANDSDSVVTGFNLVAELTNIPSGRMYDLTGSGINS